MTTIIENPYPVDYFMIERTERLDRITVYLESWPNDTRLIAGRLVVVCWGRAWCASWGNMGMDLARFVATSDAQYLADNLACGIPAFQGKDMRIGQEWYLRRVSQAVIDAVKQRLWERDNG